MPEKKKVTLDMDCIAQVSLLVLSHVAHKYLWAHNASHTLPIINKLK